MKKPMAYILSSIVLLSSLSGCGRMGGMGDDYNPTPVPAATATPIIVTPDPYDGVVRDEDGIIDDRDTGREGAVQGSAAPGATVRPKTGNTSGTVQTPSPSPTPENGMDN